MKNSIDKDIRIAVSLKSIDSPISFLYNYLSIISKSIIQCSILVKIINPCIYKNDWIVESNRASSRVVCHFYVSKYCNKTNKCNQRFLTFKNLHIIDFRTITGHLKNHEWV